MSQAPQRSRALMTYAEASAHLNMKLGTLYALVSERRIPHLRFSARLVRFDPDQLDRWLAERQVEVGRTWRGHGRKAP